MERADDAERVAVNDVGVAHRGPRILVAERFRWQSVRQVDLAASDREFLLVLPRHGGRAAATGRYSDRAPVARSVKCLWKLVLMALVVPFLASCCGCGMTRRAEMVHSDSMGAAKPAQAEPAANEAIPPWMPASTENFEDSPLCSACESVFKSRTSEKSDRVLCICGVVDCPEEDRAVCNDCMAAAKYCDGNWGLEDVESVSTKRWERRAESLLQDIVSELKIDRNEYLRIERRVHGSLTGEKLWELRYSVLRRSQRQGIQ
ncbi:hypothetical protein [Sorangium sp. So ce388]|uniref:hypothetical protein n=1 Tax=Sorangium sp. So ce388 TaxID=3133309 RepID=UPI003F5C7838